MLSKRSSNTCCLAAVVTVIPNQPLTLMASRKGKKEPVQSSPRDETLFMLDDRRVHIFIASCILHPSSSCTAVCETETPMPPVLASCDLFKEACLAMIPLNLRH